MSTEIKIIDAQKLNVIVTEEVLRADLETKKAQTIKDRDAEIVTVTTELNSRIAAINAKYQVSIDGYDEMLSNWE